ncbi:alpha/beta fold hydrolase [Natronosalvus halobius]|uniref:alpha/beta fold hydrolase n=1 Tax=Natronosalvus halobius TaxID=2953746 RepID=UPI0020A05FDA|nr:alpha/beta hydrolase [Natronosalvus halobius]USZ72047.1 alpha/beta hydrolase [Natronosalvus halobius]
MTRATNGDVELAYEVGGRPDGEPVVFVEGLGYGRWMWRWQREALADEYRTILWDNRGTGDSDAPEGPYTIQEMAGDLEAVLADAGVDRAHLVGASMGGMIVQRYALEYDRAATLSLLCTTPGGPEAVPVPEETQEAMFAVPEDADERERIRHRMAPAVSPTFFEENPDLADDIVDWRLESDASDAARQAQAAGVAEFDAADEVSALDVPVVILHGSDDQVVPVENGHLLENLIPQARFEACDGGHHLFFVERSDWVNDRVFDFLEANPIEADLEAGGESTAEATLETGDRE